MSLMKGKKRPRNGRREYISEDYFSFASEGSGNFSDKKLKGQKASIKDVSKINEMKKEDTNTVVDPKGEIEIARKKRDWSGC